MNLLRLKPLLMRFYWKICFKFNWSYSSLFIICFWIFKSIWFELFWIVLSVAKKSSITFIIKTFKEIIFIYYFSSNIVFSVAKCFEEPLRFVHWHNIQNEWKPSVIYSRQLLFYTVYSSYHKILYITALFFFSVIQSSRF